MRNLRKIFLSFSLIFLAPLSLYAASLSISPTSGTYHVGDTVNVRVVVSSSAPINAVSGVVSFPSSLFQIDSISKAGSILNFWVSEPNFSRGAGSLQFEGVTLGGFPGGTGTVITATLHALNTGSGKISFTSGHILANDGEGTDVTDNLEGATYSVVVAVTPPKEQEKPPVKTITPVEVPVVEAPQPKPTLESPQISLGSKYGDDAIVGTSGYPKAHALVTFVSEDGIKIFIDGATDEKGEFVLLVPKTLKRGTYKVSAVVIEADTTNSFASNEITIHVGSLFSDIGKAGVIAGILLILVLLYLIFRIIEESKKRKEARVHIHKEVKEAEVIVHSSFKVLEEDAMATKQAKKDLHDAEDLIIKEIKDIEK